MAKRDLIEQRVMTRKYETAKSARTAVTRSHLHGRVKKRLHAIIDTWPDPNAMPIGAPNPPPRAVPKLALGPTHVTTDPIDRAAMLLLKYAVLHKMSMDDAFLKLQERINSIAVDG